MFTIKINDKQNGNSELRVDFDALPENVRAEVVRQGLSKMLNAKSAKLSPREAAERKLKSMQEGKVRASAAGKEGYSGKEKTEAMRLARTAVKAGIKDTGFNISDYSATNITEMAKEYLAEFPETWEKARENVQAAEALAPKAQITKEPDPERVAKREAEKAKKTAKPATKGKAKGKAKPAAHVQA
jgi:hypothetical protein